MEKYRVYVTDESECLSGDETRGGKIKLNVIFEGADAEKAATDFYASIKPLYLSYHNMYLTKVVEQYPICETLDHKHAFDGAIQCCSICKGKK